MQETRHPFIAIALTLLSVFPAPASATDAVTVTTPRGATLQVAADLPTGTGPFPAIVLAPGQGYHMALPAMEQTAQRLVAQGIAVYRFNWAYFSDKVKGGGPSDDLSRELEDLRTVLAVARAEPRVNPSQLSVGGKSLGSLLAWRAFAADPSLRGGLFLTPVCSHVPKGQTSLVEVADENYPHVDKEHRPMAFIAGDRDPLCASAVLYRFAAKAGTTARVAVVGGDHGFGNRTLTGGAAAQAESRNVSAAARLAADFVAEVSGQ
jgi:predicted alpha/beta-hydrolase family hydrolase